MERVKSHGSEYEYNSMYDIMAHAYITKLDMLDILTDYFKECARIPYPLLEALDHIEPHTDARPVVFCKDCEYNRFCAQYIEVHGKYYHIDYCSGSEHSGAVKK